jgi:hypothetical protein
MIDIQKVKIRVYEQLAAGKSVVQVLDETKEELQHDTDIALAQLKVFFKELLKMEMLLGDIDEFCREQIEKEGK